MSELIQLDHHLFHLVNSDWHTPFLDWLMPYWRSKEFWIPFYVLLSGFVLYQYGVKGLIFLLFAGLTIGISDPVSSQLLKKNIQRVRPCNDEEIRPAVKLLVPCGSGYSFTSSHATNHFALAVFLMLTLGRRFRRARWLLLLWAGSIAFGQVYVGVHYPFDVLGGAIAGSLIGSAVAWLYGRFPEKWTIPSFGGRERRSLP